MKKPAASQPNFGNMLNAHVRKNRFSQAELARNLGVNKETLSRYMKQPDIRLSSIWSLCQTLHYNFLADLAGQLPPDLPSSPTLTDQRIEELQAQLHAMQTECDGLQREVNVLKATIAAAMNQNASNNSPACI